MTDGIYSFQAGAGPFGGPIVGFVTAGFTLVVGRYAFSVARSPIVRLVIGLLFVVPAAYAGYDVTRALSHLGIPEEWWREFFAVLGAIAVGGTAWANVSMLTDPALRPGVTLGPISATEWGDDDGRVTLRVYRRSVGISADIRRQTKPRHRGPLCSLRLSRSISSADCNPVVAGTALTSVSSVTEGRLSARQICLFFAGNAELLVWADR